MKNTVLIILAFFVSAYAMAQTETFTDSRDGQTYKIKTFEFTDASGKKVKRTWMLENLRHKLDKGSYAVASKVSGGKEQIYYVGSAIKNACPKGWHIPDKAEWMMLINKFGGLKTAGLALKSSNSWKYKQGNNSSGLNISPTGTYKVDLKKLDKETQEGIIWAQKEKYGYKAVGVFYWGNSAAYRTFSYDDKKAFCIRCVRDEVSSDNSSAGVSNNKSNNATAGVSNNKPSNKPNNTNSTPPKKKSYKNPIKKLISDPLSYITFTDKRDGQKYKIKKLEFTDASGKKVTKTWMAENIRYKLKQGGSYTATTKFPDSKNYEVFYAEKSARFACPAGWHLPDKSEYEMLVDKFGGKDKAGLALKSIKNWKKDEWTKTNGNNSSGLNFKPVGSYNIAKKKVEGINTNVYFWAKFEESTSKYVSLWSLGPETMYGNYFPSKDKKYAYNVRCVQDDVVSVADNNVSNNNMGSLTDPRDGQKYQTVKIKMKNDGGVLVEREWMAQNLNYKTPNSVEITYLPKGMKAGRVYTWKDAITVCPTGWHLPEKGDWQALIDHFGGKKEGGKQLRGKRDGGTNSSGFNACTVGKSNNERNMPREDESPYWTSSTMGTGLFYLAWIYPTHSAVDAMVNEYKASVRCIKDQKGDAVNSVNSQIISDYTSTDTQKELKVVKGYLKYSDRAAYGRRAIDVSRKLPKVYTVTADDVEVKDNTIVKFKKRSAERNIVIPSKIGGVTIMKIGKDAFNNKNVRAVKLPNTLKSIEKGAFKLNYLVELVIPASVTHIGESAFAYNELMNLTVPKSVKELGNKAFAGNNIKELNLPATVKLGDAAFTANKIHKLNSKESKGYIYAQSGNGSVDKSTLNSYGGHSAEPEIPANVKVIGSYSFSGTGLVSVNIPSTVQKINSYAFFKNMLMNVKLPATLKHLGDYAFGSNLLSSIKIPNGIKIIEFSAFRDNLLEEVTISSNATAIRMFAFANNKIKSIKWGLKLKQIEREAFAGNQLTSVKIPKGVTFIGTSAFVKNNITSISLPIGLKFLSKNVFSRNKAITTINGKPSKGFIFGRLANGNEDKTHILDYVGKKDATVVIPNNVQFISDIIGAKFNKLPKNIEILDSYFKNVSGDEKIQLPSDAANTLTGKPSYVPEGKEEVTTTLKPGEYYTRKCNNYLYFNAKKYTPVKIRVELKVGDLSYGLMPAVMFTCNNKTYLLCPGQHFETIAIKNGKVNYTASMYLSGTTYRASGVIDTSKDKEVTITLTKK